MGFPWWTWRGAGGSTRTLRHGCARWWSRRGRPPRPARGRRVNAHLRGAWKEVRRGRCEARPGREAFGTPLPRWTRRPPHPPAGTSLPASLPLTPGDTAAQGQDPSCQRTGSRSRGATQPTDGGEGAGLDRRNAIGCPRRTGRRGTRPREGGSADEPGGGGKRRPGRPWRGAAVSGRSPPTRDGRSHPRPEKAAGAHGARGGAGARPREGGSVR